MRRKGKNISILLIVLLLIQIVFENSLFCFRVNADTDVSNTFNSLEETDTDDYGNSIEEASVVYQNSIVEDIEGKIDYCGDIDYIKFYPSGSNTLIIESYGEGSLSGYLYDEDGNLLVSDKFSGEGQNFKFEYEFKCAKAYYLAIKSYSITNYKLKIHEKYLGPQKPTNVSGSKSSFYDINIWWSHDIFEGVNNKYEVYVNDEYVGTSNRKSYLYKRPKIEGEYRIKVRAIDEYGEYSDFSEEIIVPFYAKVYKLGTVEEFNYSNEVYNNLYKIIPDETKVYELSFSTDIGSCVYLSDSERNILFSTSSQNNSTGKIVYELKAGETYYIYFYIKYKKTDNKISSKIFDGVPELEIQQELSLSKQSYENIPLKWENIIENETVVEYEIYRDGKYIDKTINSYYTDKDVLPNKEYEYKIYGVNKYNNKVSVSNTLIASRKMENEPPSTPKITNINVGSTSAAFMWDYCKDNVGISKYEIYLDGKYVKSEEAIYNYSNVSKLRRKTSHTIKVRAVDICGNKSDFSEEVFITTKDDDYCSERGVYPEIKLGEEIKGMFNYSFDSDLFKFEAKDTILSTITLDVNDRYKDKIIIRIIAHGDNFKSYSYATEKVFDLQLLAGTTYYIGPDSEMFYTTNYTFSMKQSEVPNEVKNKQLINKDDHSVSIKWDPATDDVGIKCYNIYRDNMLIGSVDGNTTNYQDKGLYSSTKYKYEVEAEDDSGNKSSKCDYLCVTTDKDTIAPKAATNLKCISKTDHSITLGWDDAIDNEKVKNYDVYIDDQYVETVDSTSITVYNLEDRTEYSFKVIAKDEYDNTSEFSEEVTIKTILIDKPINLKCDSKGKKTIRLSWDQLKDNEIIEKYYIYINGEKRYETEGLTFAKFCFNPGTTYKFNVSAVDAEGNESPLSDEIVVTTDSEDMLSAPTNLKCDSKGKKTIRLSWDQLKDNEIIEKYYIYINGEKRYETEGLTFAKFCFNPGTTYKFNVSAVDVQGNESPLSEEIIVTTESE